MKNYLSLLWTGLSLGMVCQAEAPFRPLQPTTSRSSLWTTSLPQPETNRSSDAVSVSSYRLATEKFTDPIRMTPEWTAACREITEDLRSNILSFWQTRAPDPAGGFYGQLLYDGQPRPEAPKGGVLNARILWTFSTAYRLFKDPVYKELADRAQHYFITYFIDPHYGGTYWSLNADGTPKDTDKQTYGLSYAIYGLAEHYRATGDKESLEKAMDLFRTLEKHAWDPIYGGYIESFTRDWQKPPRYGYDGKGIAPKTMNTHLHVLEAYTALCRINPQKEIRQALQALIDIALYKIVDVNTWHENLYFTQDWKSLENIHSYGHDIEFSWLLTEAAEVLKDPERIREAHRTALQVAATQMKEGRTPDGAMMYEKDGDNLRADLEWWPQAESVVGFANAWQISGDTKYKEAALQTWEWIKNNMIDSTYGEWYSTVKADGTPVKKAQKASMWRCPYHNSRMGMEIYERFLDGK